MKECGDVYYYVKELLIKLSILSSLNEREVFTDGGLRRDIQRGGRERKGGRRNILNMGPRHVTLRDYISSVI
jgi:hypothetical protein